MAYVKNTWVDQEGQVRYRETQDGDFKILTPNYEQVTEIGTPVNADNMNHIEDGIDGCAIRKHNLTETFNLGEWVLGGTGDDEGIYKSLIANNVGNALTDDTKWEKVNLGGSSRNIGEIVTSTIPLTDAGLHLLDGALLQYGSYQAFVDYIADLYDSGDYTDIFETEANWQSAVTQYGVCGKFVYNSTNNTVRLPKYSNKIFTGEGTAPVIGNGLTLGLTDGANQYGLATASMYGTNANDLVFSTNQGLSVGSTPSIAIFNANYNAGVTTNPSKSGLIADLSGITTSLDGYYYIVVATTSKTAIQVDIDEIATDLNGKADVDLTNVTTGAFSNVLTTANASDKETIQSWLMPDYSKAITVYNSSGWGSLTIDWFGWLEFDLYCNQNSAAYQFYIDSITVGATASDEHDRASGIVLVKSGSVASWNGSQSIVIRKIPFVGG